MWEELEEDLHEEFVNAITKGDIFAAKEQMRLCGLFNVNSWCKQYRYLCNVAEHNASEDIKNLLLSLTNEQNGTKILIAAMNDYNEDVANFIIDHINVDVNACDENGNSLLHIATEQLFKRVVEVLSFAVDNIDNKNKQRSTALHLAAVHDDDEITDTLLNHGATCDLQDVFGRTALHIAVRNGSTDVINKLLEYGADVNATCNRKMTPLAYDPESKILKEHIIAIKVLNRYVHNENFKYIDLDGADREIFEDYKKKFAELKTQKIENSNKSVYDFLTCHENRLAFYVRNSELVNAASQSWPRAWYNDFHKRIKLGTNRVQKFNLCLESLEIAVRALFDKNLPDVDIAYNIIDYLDYSDMMNLIKAAPSSDK